MISRSSSCVDAKRALGGDHRGGGTVVGGARLLHVGDGNETDLIARLGLGQLAVDRNQRDLLRLDIVLCAEHIEVALRDPLHQVLLRGLIVRFGLRHLRIRALQRLPVLPAKQTLLEVDGVLMNGGVDLAAEWEGFGNRRGRTRRQHRARRPVSWDRRGAGTSVWVWLIDPAVAFARYVAVAGQLGQQRRQRLGFGLQGGQARGLSLPQLWVVLQGPLINGQKIRRRERRLSARYKAKPIASRFMNYPFWGVPEAGSIVLYTTISPK